MMPAMVTAPTTKDPTNKRRSSTLKLQPRVQISSMSKAFFLPQRHSGISRVLSDKQIKDDAQCLEKIVLKMTMQTEEDLVTSFVIPQGSNEAGIGKRPINTVCIPADKYMCDVNHAIVEHYDNGGFYITNGNDGKNDTYVRLFPLDSKDPSTRTQWPLSVGCQFRAGKSDFIVTEIAPTALCLHIVSGKLAGSVYTIDTDGATIGRSADNTIHMGDGELSRRHASIWYNNGNYYLVDVGSTNGTFMKLCGAYGAPFRLEIGDHLLLSQTCLTVSRFDYGINDDMGYRKHMEDAHTLI
ncbi:hypothetical protein THRCLA_05411, partial [Thraustotheca clavata]